MLRCLGLLVAVFAATAAQESPLPWWKTATLYQVYPRSFQDTNGDGTGDLKGITQRAEYFKEIGVDAIWISPFFKSPMVDNGYDISDFRDVDPLFGTLGDFKELVAKFKSLDIKVLLDMVPNHCSDQHEWFKKSLNKEDPYTNYFVWNDGKIDPATGKRVPPNNWRGLFYGSAWEWREERKQYYFHQFTPQQIDFDYRNPAVLKEMDDMMTFWLDLGIDGLRMDAVIFLWEHDYNVDEPLLPGASGQTWLDYNHTQTLCQPEDIQIQNHWNELVYNYSKRDGKQRVIFVEAYAKDSYIMQLYGHGNTSFTSPFNFKLLMQGNQNLQAPQIRDIMKGYLALLSGDQTPNWVIGNHDNMRLANRYGPEAVDAMGMLLGVLPGVKVVYYGEEIGMQDTYIRPDQAVDPGSKSATPETQLLDRDPPRTPMQWDDSTPNAGFSSAIKTWLPVNPNYWWLNVEAQRRAEKSHLKVFQDVSRLRKDRVLQRGTTDILAPNDNTLAVIRSYNGTFYAYIFNIGSEIINVTLQDITTFPVGITVSVEVASINSKFDKGTLLKSSDRLTLRPKAAVILRSPPSASSASTSLGVSGLIILPFLLLRFTVHFLA